VFISFQNIEVLVHRLSQKLLLTIAISSSECTDAVTGVGKTNSSIRILALTDLLCVFKLSVRLFSHSVLFQQHRFEANYVGWKMVARLLDVILKSFVNILK
jgi:hypothetical protein